MTDLLLYQLIGKTYGILQPYDRRERKAEESVRHFEDYDVHEIQDVLVFCSENEIWTKLVYTTEGGNVRWHICVDDPSKQVLFQMRFPRFG